MDLKNKTGCIYKLLIETHFRPKDICRWKVKRQKKVFYANKNKKKSSTMISRSGKLDLKTKTVIRDKTRHYLK